MNGSATPRLDYHQRRARQEREAADRAASDEARRIHAELADRYAALAQA